MRFIFFLDYYIYTLLYQDEPSAGSVYRIRSPQFSFTDFSSNIFILDLFLHMKGDAIGTLNVYIEGEKANLDKELELWAHTAALLQRWQAPVNTVLSYTATIVVIVVEAASFLYRGSVSSASQYLSTNACDNLDIALTASGIPPFTGCLFFCFVLFYLPYLSSIHEKANCIAILWTGSPHSLGSCLFRGLWVTCLPHKGGASR